jgi:hypothetical protein
MTSGSYYCTNELANELTRINNAVDHLKLDGNIMSTSDSFKRFYDPRNSVPEGISEYSIGLSVITKLITVYIVYTHLQH